MAFQIVTRALTNNTADNFRLWGKAISDQFDAGGWSKVGTGHIDWATVAAPGAINTSMGFEMWSSNDAAGSLVNFFVKIEYGSAAVINNPAVWITIGWAHDGAGNLTGVMTTRKQLTMTIATPTTTVYQCNLSASAGRVHISMGTIATVAFFFAISRTRNSALALENRVNFIANFGAGSAPYNVTMDQTMAYPDAVLTGNLPPTTAANAVQGGAVGLGFVFGVCGVFTNPLESMYLVNSGQIGGAGSVVNLTTYGVSVPYIVLPAIAALNIHSSTSLNGLMRAD